MKVHRKSRSTRPSSWRFLVAAVAMSAGTVRAGVVATNADVPANMSPTGGTEGDPKVYVFDNFAKDFGSTSITLGTAAGASWIRLEIRNGAAVTTTGASNRIGSDSSSYTNASNSVLVTGAGSSLTMGAGRFGGMSPNNSLTINDGGTVTLTGDLTCGYNNTAVATNNTVIVDNATINLGANRFRIGYGDGHNFNTMIVRNGGLVSTTGRMGVRYGKYCDFHVEGPGSRIMNGYASTGAMTLGESSVYAHHNTVTLVDGGVFALTNSGGTLTLSVDANEGGSGIRFANGIFAVMGNRTTHVPANRAWLWDGDSWEPAPNDWTGTYYADETSAAAAGFSGFGGYTVFTGGEPLNPPAPKMTLVLIR